MSSTNYNDFQRVVWHHYRAHGRHDLPWRKTRDPYRILVSEVMLQQTQVSRVIEKYRSFLKKFPTVRTLANARLAEVLKEWSGLGYNRRGKYLHDAAKMIVKKYGGRVPKDAATLRQLPGMGAYTASAVRVFAFDLPDILIETNVRTAIIHHFFLSKSDLHKKDTKISDAQMIPFLHEAATGQDPREWHWALMDYGAHLKKIGVRYNSYSKHYVKQTKFEGSTRQVRGAILRALSDKKDISLVKAQYAEHFEGALASLVKDHMIICEKGMWRVV